MKSILLFSVVLLLAISAYTANYLYGETPKITGQKWHVHDVERPLPKIVTPGESSGPVEPPSDALVLFDGTNLDQFRNKTLEIENGAMVMGEGGQQTLENFGDVQLHLEWASPSPPLNQGQDRGNSGVFLMGLYEIQVLDSFQNKTYPDGQAGAVYGVHPPMVNASRAPDEWQSYDIFFQAPRFDAEGHLHSPAYVTVVHNGVLVQLNQAFNGASTWRRNGSYKAHESKLPLALQWHDSQVRYRNIWIRSLDDDNHADEHGNEQFLHAVKKVSKADWPES
jgi:3-keto-disaccharide hydrolase